MTPRQIDWAFEGLVKRLEYEREARVAHAWQTGELVKIAFHAPKKYPTFEKISGKRKKTVQTEDQMLALARILVAKHGGEVRHG